VAASPAQVLSNLPRIVLGIVTHVEAAKVRSSPAEAGETACCSPGHSPKAGSGMTAAVGCPAAEGFRSGQVSVGLAGHGSRFPVPGPPGQKDLQGPTLPLDFVVRRVLS